MDQRGKDRRLKVDDFGRGKIDRFTVSDLGPGWENVHAVVGYRLNDFLSRIPYRWKITSAWRSLKTNTAAGGSKNSPHLKGNAIDLWIFDPDFFKESRLKHYIDLAREVGFNGVGIYKDKKFIHMDYRDKPGSWGGIQTAGSQKTTKFISLAAALKSFSSSPAAIPVIPLVVLALILLRGRQS